MTCLDTRRVFSQWHVLYSEELIKFIASIDYALTIAMVILKLTQVSQYLPVLALLFGYVYSQTTDDPAVQEHLKRRTELIAGEKLQRQGISNNYHSYGSI